MLETDNSTTLKNPLLQQIKDDTSRVDILRGHL